MHLRQAFDICSVIIFTIGVLSIYLCHVLVQYALPRSATITYLSRASTISLNNVTSTTPPANDPRWLLGIFSSPGAGGAKRRSIIRSTWVTRYPNPAYRCMFVLGHYSDHPRRKEIDAENATYGDIFEIADFTNENRWIANRVKNLEFFKYLDRYGGERFPRYDFVSKVDDDNWLNIPRYYELFMQSRLPMGDRYEPSNLTFIGRPIKWGQDFIYAAGKMYTLSWPLIHYMAVKYAEEPKTGRVEDVVLGYYLYKDQLPSIKFVALELEQMYDVGIECIITENTILVHSIKHDDTLLEISKLFDERGRWNKKRSSGLTHFDRRHREVIKRIGQPDEHEVELLKKYHSRPEYPVDPWDTLDWEMIQKKSQFEDRELLGNFWPLTLPGNNDSTGVVPRRYGWCLKMNECTHRKSR